MPNVINYMYQLSILGTFAVNTNHAANLDREPNEYMAWSILSIKLAWLGFEDIHSGTSYYEINIGSHFMGNDLNEVTA